MTQMAREVLSDARRAVEDFEGAGVTQYWRTRWVAVVGLLRAVGHVLEGVDRDGSPTMRKAIDEAWSHLRLSRPEPKIFWEFIQDERNNVLKAYQFTAHLSITVLPGSLGFNIKTGEQWSTPGGPPSFRYFMKSGPFADLDPVQLSHEAIAFWTKYLEDIDRAAT